MVDFFLSPTFVIVLLLFYWVPFAAGAYFTDHWKPKHTRASEPKRPSRVFRHADAAT